MPESLPRLWRLTLGHCGDKGGFDLGRALPLLHAAPNLTSLHLQKTYVKGLPADLKLEKATFLAVGGCIDSRQLDSLLQLCPNVEELRYECGGACFGDEQFTPEEAVDSTVFYAPRIKRMSLDLEAWAGLDEEGFTEEDMQAAKDVLEGRGVECVFII